MKVLLVMAIFMYRKLKKIWQGLNTRYIFFRHLYVLECPVRKSVVGRARKKKGFRARRIRRVDGETAKKLEAALGRMDFHPPFDVAEARYRLERNNIFMILEHEDEIVGWSWFAVKSIYVPEIEKVVELEDGVALSLNTYIQPNYRRKGLGQFLVEKKRESMRRGNFRKWWALIYTWNTSSLRASRIVGASVIAHYYYIRFFLIKIRYKRYLTSKKAAALTF